MLVCAAMDPRTPYTAALRLATPLLFARLLWRARRAPGYRARWGERLGYVPPLPGECIWVHAVSVGETIAARGLIERLMHEHRDRPMLVTSTTPTGSARVRALFGDRVHHCYLPYDVPGAVCRFLDRTQPALGIIMETEIWPNLLAAAEQRRVPIMLANARLSARSAAGYARIPKLTATALRRFAAIAAQTEADAARLRTLGAPPERIAVTGSLKFDQDVSDAHREAGRTLREGLGTRPVWVAASTHEGEDAAVLDAHRTLRQHFADATLILVPRHPERFDAVARQAQAAGFRIARRSAATQAELGLAEVLIGDTMGELPALLAAGDLAFMGGSLVDVGGHNPLEPAALALPVLSGPAVHNFSEIFRMLESAGAARFVSDGGTLAAAVQALFTDPQIRTGMGTAAAAVMAANRGALERVTATATRLLRSR